MAGEAEIAALDASLARAGEDVVLSRIVKRSGVDVTVSVTCRAACRSVRAEEIVGTIAQNDLALVLSPSEITKAGFPGVDQSTPSGSLVDQRFPRTTDKMFVQGRDRQVKASKPILVGGAWVRVDMIVAG